MFTTFAVMFGLIAFAFYLGGQRKDRLIDEEQRYRTGLTWAARGNCPPPAILSNGAVVCQDRGNPNERARAAAESSEMLESFKRRDRHRVHCFLLYLGMVVFGIGALASAVVAIVP
jgi:hypothetical protein